jgi:hypothetical protein
MLGALFNTTVPPVKPVGGTVPGEYKDVGGVSEINFDAV